MKLFWITMIFTLFFLVTLASANMSYTHGYSLAKRGKTLKHVLVRELILVVLSGLLLYLFFTTDRENVKIFTLLIFATVLGSGCRMFNGWRIGLEK